MRKTVYLIMSLCLALVMPAHAKPKSMNVDVIESQLRATPAYFGSVVETVKRGDKLEILERKEPWLKVRNPATGNEGWIHEGALTKKKVELQSGSENLAMNASSGELALAEKNFNERVEKKFRENHKDIDFSWIDKMEKIKVSNRQSRAFLKAGDVKPPEGGAE